MKPMKPMTVDDTLAACEKVLKSATNKVYAAGVLLQQDDAAGTLAAEAFALAHLATEEMIKLQAFRTIAVELVRGQLVDWKYAGKQLSDHLTKIRAVLLLDYMRTQHVDAAQALQELSNAMAGAGAINDLKNDSLYVSQANGRMQQPAEDSRLDKIAHGHLHPEIFIPKFLRL